MTNTTKFSSDKVLPIIPFTQFNTLDEVTQRNLLISWRSGPLTGKAIAEEMGITIGLYNKLCRTLQVPKIHKSNKKLAQSLSTEELESVNFQGNSMESQHIDYEEITNVLDTVATKLDKSLKKSKNKISKLPESSVVSVQQTGRVYSPIGEPESSKIRKASEVHVIKEDRSSDDRELSNRLNGQIPSTSLPAVVTVPDMAVFLKGNFPQEVMEVNIKKEGLVPSVIIMCKNPSLLSLCTDTVKTMSLEDPQIFFGNKVVFVVGYVKAV